MVKASATPSCGLSGAAKAAELQAAVETIRAGYDRYQITYGASADNTRVEELPGEYKTHHIAGHRGEPRQVTVYQPGPTVVNGSYDHAFAIKMFREGEAGSAKAISAREILGPNWPKRVKDGVRTCSIL